MMSNLKPRILFLTQTHNLWGGIESWFDELTLWLQNRAWDVHIGLAKGARYNNPKRFWRAHPHINSSRELDASVGTEEARIKSIVNVCKACQPDIVVPVALGAIFPAIRVLKSRRPSPRLILPVHSLHQAYLQNILDNFEVIDQVVGVSRLIERFFLRSLPDETARIHYIRNGVAAPIIERSERSATLRVGYIGRLEHASKRVLDLIPLHRCLREIKLHLELHIFGEGPDQNTLMNELLDCSCSCRVIFHGYVPGAVLYCDVYPKLDVLIMFSPTEGSPLTLYEAMHHGVVPVASRFLGYACEGVLQHERNAFTFEVGDVMTAVRQLALLAQTPKFLRKLSIQAKLDVAEYLVEKNCSEWERLFLTSLSTAPRLPNQRTSPLRESSSYGRLERYGVSPRVSQWIRSLLRRKFPHSSGFDEWPGSQPVSGSAISQINNHLRTIESEAMSELYTAF